MGLRVPASVLHRHCQRRKFPLRERPAREFPVERYPSGWRIGLAGAGECGERCTPRSRRSPVPRPQKEIRPMSDQTPELSRRALLKAGLGATAAGVTFPLWKAFGLPPPAAGEELVPFLNMPRTPPNR